MKTLITIVLFTVLQYSSTAQCINTDLNPTQSIGLPSFSGYQMVVADNITAGDFFNLAYVTDNLTPIVIDEANGLSTYVQVFYSTTSGNPILYADGPAPFTFFPDIEAQFEVHINTVSPPCGTDNINRTITFECPSCPLHKGVGINVDEVDPTAALHIGNDQGSLLLPTIDNAYQTAQPKAGLLHFDSNSKELEFYDGAQWNKTLSTNLSKPNIDIRVNESNTEGTKGAMLSIYNTAFGNNKMSGLRLFNGNTERSSSSSLFYRSSKLHFAQKPTTIDTISIADSFLEMDRNSFNFTGTETDGLQIKRGSINTSQVLRLNNESLNAITLAQNGGKVSIGTNSFYSDFDVAVAGPTVFLDNVYFDDDVSLGEKLAINASSDQTTNLRINGQENNGTNSSLKIVANNQTLMMDGNEIDSYSTGLYLQNNSDDDIVLANGGGLVGVAETSPRATLHIKEVGTSTALMIENNSNSSDWSMGISVNDLLFYFNNTFKASVNDVNGAWVQTSDRRLKKEITYDNRSVLPNLLSLRPASYKYIDNKADDPKSYGFIAQEVQELFPELVIKSDEDYLAISYSEFSVLAIKAIQEQQAIIETMESKYEALLKRVEQLEK